jgi:hypothetical protein
VGTISLDVVDEFWILSEYPFDCYPPVLFISPWERCLYGASRTNQGITVKRRVESRDPSPYRSVNIQVLKGHHVEVRVMDKPQCVISC